MICIGFYSDDRTLHSLLSSALGKDFQVLLGSTEDEIKQMLDTSSCDVVILDLDPTQESLRQRTECCRRIVAAHDPSIMVVMADDSFRSAAAELVRLGAYSYCRRPPSIRDLKATLHRAYEHSLLKRELRLQREHVESVYSCDQLIGSGSRMQEVYDLVHRVANVNASVLVIGESGTGKELIAKAIHRLGNRSAHPFMAVCCGAIPETLIEDELFGHEKGAFTGTIGARVGLLEQAGAGTVFLDEIGELSMSAQVKLLRVLQEHEFSRLGSNRLIPLRARLIFATHQDLAEMVAQGTFREDLYYRINVMRIDVPSLQEHQEDVPQIANHFLRLYSRSFEKPMDCIEPEAMAILESYPWPGNIRELENVIQRGIVVARGTRLTCAELPQHMQEEEEIVRIDDCAPASSFERQLRAYKVKLAEAAVREHKGNKTLAARNLQISRAYLHRLLRGSDPEMITKADHPRLEIA